MSWTIEGITIEFQERNECRKTDRMREGERENERE